MVVLLAGLAGCSDANTPEEKAWVDDGIDPRIVTVFTPPRFSRWAEAVVEEYGEVEPRARVVVATAGEADVLARIAANPGPSVWLGDPGHLVDTADPGEPVEATVIARDPLALSWTSAEGDVAGELEAFGGGDRPTGLCEPDTECGRAAHELLEEHGIAPRPTTTYTDPAELTDALRDGEVTAGLVQRSFAVARFPGVSATPLTGADAHPRPVELRRYGASDLAADLARWITEPEQMDAMRRQHGLLPADPATG